MYQQDIGPVKNQSWKSILEEKHKTNLPAYEGTYTILTDGKVEVDTPSKLGGMC